MSPSSVRPMQATEAVYSGNPYFSGVNAWADGPDIEKAKALLAEAGIEGSDVRFRRPAASSRPRSRRRRCCSSSSRRAGITMNIQNYESGEWITRLFAKEYNATISYWSATLDPAHFYYPGLLSTSGWNITGYGTPEMDAALNAFAQGTGFRGAQGGVRGADHALPGRGADDPDRQSAAAVLGARERLSA